MSFKKEKYCIVKKAVSKELCNFLENYLLLKRQCSKTLFDTKQISPYCVDYGKWSDEQIPNTYNCYSDMAMETLLLKFKPTIEKITNFKLSESYSYIRIYKKGDILKRHKDRNECEVSTTLNIGGDNWPIYLSPYENVGVPDNKKITVASKAKGVKINLDVGDMLIYLGCELEHWRNKFNGQDCLQSFFHYNIEKKGIVKFDSRLHVGLPSYTKRK
jgi:hypothetical protein|tara:strand:+ start:1061 stop:1708 length:648 start_codon:yes stop_codon:yes gene_type:complete